MRKKFFCFLFAVLTFLLTAPVFVLNAVAQANGVKVPTGTGLPDRPVRAVLVDVVKWLMATIGFAAVIFIIVSGIQYITAAGDERRAETAKKNLMYSIGGLVIALLAYVIIYTIDQILGGGGQSPPAPTISV